MHLADLLMDQMLQIEFQVLLSTINMCFCLLLERRFGRIVMSDSLLALKERDDNFLYLCLVTSSYNTPRLQPGDVRYYNVWIQCTLLDIMCGYNSLPVHSTGTGGGTTCYGAGAGAGCLGNIRNHSE